MKKIFTLLFAVGTMTAVFAQPGHSTDRRDSRDVVFGKTQTTTVYNVADNHSFNSFNSRERDKQIKQINKDYDKQIKSVMRNRWMNSFEKNRQIRMLEAQRDQKIREVNNSFTEHGFGRDDHRMNSRW
jgi:hypothetical protein